MSQSGVRYDYCNVGQNSVEVAVEADDCIAYMSKIDSSGGFDHYSGTDSWY